MPKHLCNGRCEVQSDKTSDEGCWASFVLPIVMQFMQALLHLERLVLSREPYISNIDEISI